MLKFLAGVMVAALASAYGWNFHIENIIVAKETDHRVMETGLSKRLHDIQLAYDDALELSITCENELGQALGGNASVRQNIRDGDGVMIDPPGTAQTTVDKR